jgi:predicted PurR-regulated permease PerM
MVAQERLVVLFWGWMRDVWGFALAIPITIAVKAAADHIEPLQPSAISHS